MTLETFLELHQDYKFSFADIPKDLDGMCVFCQKPKYIKLNTKPQNIFCRLNENLMTFLYTLTGATRKQKEKKKFSLLKCIQKSNVIKKNGF